MKKFLPHLYAILFFLAVVFVVFRPVFDGKELKQTDIDNWKGMSKEITDFKESTGEQTFWTNSMFGGMPAYQISAVYPANLIQYVDKGLMLGLPTPANMVFLFLAGFYFLLITLRVDPKIAVLGAIAFAFSSYFFIVIEAGHNSKVHAIGYMAPVVAGVLMTFRGRLWLGAAVTGLAMGLELYANHLQITYYLMLVLLILGVAELYAAVKEKRVAGFVKAVALMSVMTLLAAGSNITNLMATQEYAKYSTRGQSELTTDKANKTSGLDRDYITDWSYGVGESFTLLIPGFKGSASEPIAKNHKDALKKADAGYRENLSNFGAYFGDQPFTNGPVYVGAIVVLFFLLGLFLVKGPVKWWLLSATVLSLLLSWGRNFMGFTNFFLDNVPGYDKFRAVAMILVIAEFTMPLLAVLAVDRILRDRELWKTGRRKIMYILAGVLGFTLLVLLSPGMFTDFYTVNEYNQVLDSVKGSNISQDALDSFFASLSAVRAEIVKQDALRSLMFLLFASALLLSFLRYRYDSRIFVFSLTLLVLVDLGAVNARYLGSDDFQRVAKNADPWQPSTADLAIKQDTGSFRVLNLSVNTFNDASTSYFHQSIGGYHGAKMKRYQELIENCISGEIGALRAAMSSNSPDMMQVVTGQPVLNMLNAKYIIYNKEAPPLTNFGSLGNAWFVPEYRLVPNSDTEIVAVSSFNPAAEMIVDRRYEEMLKGYSFQPDSSSNIRMTSYRPNHLTYVSSSSAQRLAVFSEIFFDKGWNAYIDGKPVPYFRTDYVLRGMVIPPGDHMVEFRFEPEVISKGETIAMASSSLLLVLAALLTFLGLRRRDEVS
ncbi:MAG: hypothetical protein RL213_1882 [Bacteroidota bacterium]|jgi:hypothetical protein